MENVYDQFFYMKYYGGWGIFELYNLPIGLRQWFVKKLGDQLEKEREEVEKSSKR